MANHLLRLIAAGALLVSTSGCALLPHASRWVQVRPMPLPQARTVDPRTSDYDTAVALIDRRDYARALDFLQAARARNADDVRVLNAFGVVYDKLGRFDLSQRYYSQAKSLLPDSPIIAHNLAYSTVLQERARSEVRLLADLSTQPQPAPAPAPAAAPSAPRTQIAAQMRPVAIMSGAGVVRLQVAPQMAAETVRPGLTGHALVIVNASGIADGAEAPRAALSNRGWSTPKAVAIAASPQPETTISYSPASAVAAQGLANTLPVKARLEVCQDGCDGIQLVVGRDLAKTFARASATTGRPG